MILDQLIRGIDDEEILADLLGDTKTDRTLAEVIDFIARKEQAKQEQGTVSFESTSAVRQTSANSSNSPVTCWACQQPSHGPNTIRTRQEKCPAWKATCDKCNTSPKPAPSVYTAVPGATKAREAENVTNPRMELMNLEPSLKPSASPS